jgi:GPH family glycoside/pentoside/hexuronide:cation symporter
MQQRLSVKEKISYGLGDMASHIGLENVIIFLTFHYTDVVGLPAVFVGTLFLLARVTDAIIDPLMGMVADRTRTRWGKFRPWLPWPSANQGSASGNHCAGQHLTNGERFTQQEIADKDGKQYAGFTQR